RRVHGQSSHQPSQRALRPRESGQIRVAARQRPDPLPVREESRCMSAQQPLVTVVTTTYDWPSALRVAMESVLAQTFRDFEYLVVGDGCTDGTAALVASFADPRIRWHNLARNSGNQSVPNRAAVEMARGKYVAYLNHDDIWFPNHLESLVEVM